MLLVRLLTVQLLVDFAGCMVAAQRPARLMQLLRQMQLAAMATGQAMAAMWAMMKTVKRMEMEVQLNELNEDLTVVGR